MGSGRIEKVVRVVAVVQGQALRRDFVVLLLAPGRILRPRKGIEGWTRLGLVEKQRTMTVLGGWAVEGGERKQQANTGETEGGRALDWWCDGLIMGLYAGDGPPPALPNPGQTPSPRLPAGGGLVAEPGSRSPPEH